MPIVNIPPRIRFALYILGMVTGPLVTYGFAKGLIGKPEVALGASLVSLLLALAAAKTDLSDTAERGRHEADPAAAIRDRNRREGRSS